MTTATYWIFREKEECSRRLRAPLNASLRISASRVCTWCEQLPGWPPSGRGRGYKLNAAAFRRKAQLFGWKTVGESWSWNCKTRFEHRFSDFHSIPGCLHPVSQPPRQGNFRRHVPKYAGQSSPLWCHKGHWCLPPPRYGVNTLKQVIFFSSKTALNLSSTQHVDVLTGDCKQRAKYSISLRFFIYYLFMN